jgi:outer membrane protein assembly factor BamB
MDGTLRWRASPVAPARHPSLAVVGNGMVYLTDGQRRHVYIVIHDGGTKKWETLAQKFLSRRRPPVAQPLVGTTLYVTLTGPIRSRLRCGDWSAEVPGLSGVRAASHR